MKKYLYSLFIAALVIGCNVNEENLPTQKYKEIITKYTEIKEIISQEVDDTFYVYIRLPKNYVEENKRYPVLYLLDGDIAFNMATSIVRYLQFGEDVHDLIIVAPAYGTLLNDRETNFRERDYTISEVDRWIGSGGAANYLNFIKKELIPLIDYSYRTNNYRILNGYSLGGLFTIYTLLNDTDLFNDYIVGSPYLFNDLDILIARSNDILGFNQDTKLFITVGELEDIEIYHKPINSLFEALKNKNGLEVKFTEFKNGTHFTCTPEALVYGLKFIFNDYKISEL